MGWTAAWAERGGTLPPPLPLGAAALLMVPLGLVRALDRAAMGLGGLGPLAPAALLRCLLGVLAGLAAAVARPAALRGCCNGRLVAWGRRKSRRPCTKQEPRKIWVG